MSAFSLLPILKPTVSRVPAGIRYEVRFDEFSLPCFINNDNDGVIASCRDLKTRSKRCHLLPLNSGRFQQSQRCAHAQSSGAQSIPLPCAQASVSQPLPKLKVTRVKQRQMAPKCQAYR